MLIKYDLSKTRDLVDDSDGVLCIQMRSLRVEAGVGALGKDVVRDISVALDELRVGHCPTHLPTRGNEWVLLYKFGGEAARLIRAVSFLNQRSGDSIRGFLNREAESKLEEVREIVGRTGGAKASAPRRSTRSPRNSRSN